MKFLKKVFFKTIIILGIKILILSNSYAIQNKILFKINNEIITSIDLFNEIEYLKILNDKLSTISKKKQFEIAKNSLIREKIREFQIEKSFKNTDIKEEYLEILINEFISKSNLMSKDQLQKIIDSKGIEMKMIIKKIKIEVFWNRLIFEKFSNKIKIDKNKIKQNIEANNVQKNYLLSEIVFNLVNEDLSFKFNKIKDEIYKNGFENAASIYSISDSAKQGGKLGWINFNSLSEVIKKEIIELNINEFTKPIVIPGGFLILKIEDKKNVKVTKDIEKEIENISRIKANKQLNQFSTIYFNKLKKEFQIDEL